jgi:recombinational DNA repair protein RecR
MGTRVIVAPSEANKTAPEPKRAKQRSRLCNVCGQPFGSKICAMCSDRIRAEALARKKREDKGEE